MLRRILCLGLLVTLATLALEQVRACTMPVPPPPELEENEICVTALGKNPITGKSEFLIGIEVGLFPPTSLATCQCGLNLGTGPLPASARILSATVQQASDWDSPDMAETPEFEGFETDDDTANELDSMDGSLENTNSYGFAVEVEPFEAPDPNDPLKYFMVFKLEVDMMDIPLLNGLPIQFGAGSTMPGHQVMLFTGYANRLNLPVPEPSTWALGVLGIAGCLACARRGRRAA